MNQKIVVQVTKLSYHSSSQHPKIRCANVAQSLRFSPTLLHHFTMSVRIQTGAKNHMNLALHIKSFD